MPVIVVVVVVVVVLELVVVGNDAVEDEREMVYIFELEL